MSDYGVNCTEKSSASLFKHLLCANRLVHLISNCDRHIDIYSFSKHRFGISQVLDSASDRLDPAGHERDETLALHIQQAIRLIKIETQIEEEQGCKCNGKGWW